MLSPGPQMSPSYPQSLPSTPSGLPQGFPNPNPNAPQTAPPPSYSATTTTDQTHFPFDHQTLQLFNTGSPNPLADRSRSALTQSPGITSEYVRQEIRNRVARTQQNHQQGQAQHPVSVGGSIPGPNVQSSLPGQTHQGVDPSEFQSLVLQLDLPTDGRIYTNSGSGDAQSKSPNMFNPALMGLPSSADGAISRSVQAQLAAANSPRGLEDSRQGEKKSLLQQLLSE